MQWPSCSPDLHSIENLWSILKRNIYSCGRQYASKDDLWDAILTAAKGISCFKDRSTPFDVIIIIYTKQSTPLAVNNCKIGVICLSLKRCQRASDL